MPQGTRPCHSKMKHEAQSTDQFLLQTKVRDTLTLRCDVSGRSNVDSVTGTPMCRRGVTRRQNTKTLDTTSQVSGVPAEQTHLAFFMTLSLQILCNLHESVVMMKKPFHFLLLGLLGNALAVNSYSLPYATPQRFSVLERRTREIGDSMALAKRNDFTCGPGSVLFPHILPYPFPYFDGDIRLTIRNRTL